MSSEPRRESRECGLTGQWSGGCERGHERQESDDVGSGELHFEGLEGGRKLRMILIRDDNEVV